MGALDGFPGEGLVGVDLLVTLGTGEGDFLLGLVCRDQVGFDRTVGEIQGPAAKGALACPMGNFFGAAGASGVEGGPCSFLWGGGLFGTGNDDGVLASGTVNFLTPQRKRGFEIFTTIDALEVNHFLRSAR